MTGQLNFDLTSSLGAHHAKDSPLLDCVEDWMTRVLNCPSTLWRLLQDIAPAGWSGRTFPVFFQAKAEPTLQTFWQRSQEGKFVSLKTAGEIAAMCKESPKHTESLGECSTLNTLEWPKDAAVCSLSDILETGDVPRRFYLSATACLGILRRAAKRGKELPEMLKAALTGVAGRIPA